MPRIIGSLNMARAAAENFPAAALLNFRKIKLLCIRPGPRIFPSGLYEGDQPGVGLCLMLVMLSRRFSLCKPLTCLYSCTVSPLHAFVISLVRMA